MTTMMPLPPFVLPCVAVCADSSVVVIHVFLQRQHGYFMVRTSVTRLMTGTLKGVSAGVNIGSLSGGVVVGLASAKSFRLTSPNFSHQLGIAFPLGRFSMSRFYLCCPQQFLHGDHTQLDYPCLH